MRAIAAAALTVLAACSDVTSGHGTASGQASSSPDFPSTPVTASVPSTTSAPTIASSSAQPTTPATSTVPSLSQRDQQLLAQTNGEPHVLARVPGGFEAATFDQSGDIQFWRNPLAATTWQQIGTSSYPYVPQLGAPHATVTGTRLRGMTHAIFIVRGTFTTDSSGNAVAFTAGGGAGWGAIKAESNGNIAPSGHPVGNDRIGLSYDFGFTNGYLVTEDCPSDRPISDCGAHPVTKVWRWTGREFVLR